MFSNQKNPPSYRVWNMSKIIAEDPKKLTAELDPEWDIRKALKGTVQKNGGKRTRE